MFLNIQNFIQNYASVINRIRPLAIHERRLEMVAFALVRASSLRKQAVPSIRPKLVKMQYASLKPRGTSLKLQATSVKLHNILPLIKFYKVKGKGLNQDKCILRMFHVKSKLMR